VIHFRFAGEIASEAHGDGACGDLGYAGDPDEVKVVVANGGAQTGGEGKGYGEPIGHADDDIREDLGAAHMLLDVAGGVGSDLVHTVKIELFTTPVNDPTH
jgi:hypothetical protein